MNKSYKNTVMQTSLFGDDLDNLLKRFEDIHNYLYANDGLSEQEVLEEIVKILFIKYYDEQNEEKNFFIKENELEEKQKKAFITRINKLFEDTKYIYSNFFDSKDSLKLSVNSLSFIVNKIQNINFKHSSEDANGMAFQKFLSRHAKEGRGQFFTPDPVINFCVEIINPQPHEKIIDPSCGTGGFLFSALNFIKHNYPQENLQNYVAKNIFGIEINKRISQIAKIKFLIDINSDPNIICQNALIDVKEIKFPQISNTNIDNYFDIIITNPPFGTQGKITQKDLLSIYDLGYKWDKHGDKYIKSRDILNGQVPEILFIEQCLKLLKPNGRAGIVLPNGHFENSSLEYLRTYIKEKADIIGVVLLPPETFIPYGTGVKASLLFLRKKSKNSNQNYQVFFSKINSLGYLGNKNATPVYKKDEKGQFVIEKNKKIIDEDFSISIQDYHTFLARSSLNSEQSFVINSQELNRRFDYNFYCPTYRNLINKLQQLNAVKLGDIVEIIKNKSPLLKETRIVEYVELSDVYTKSFEIINSSTLLTSDLPSRASYELKIGDIITAVAGNSIGTDKHATAYVTSQFNHAICTNGFRVLRNIKIDPFYLLYYLQSDLFLKQVFMYRTGAAIPSLSDSDLVNILIYLPSEKQIENISLKVKKSFQLRDEAQNEMNKIKSELSITYSLTY